MHIGLNYQVISQELKEEYNKVPPTPNFTEHFNLNPKTL